MAEMGQGVPIEGFTGWPAIPRSAGAVGRHLYVWLFLALVPQVRRVHREHSIPDALSWANLGLLVEVMRENRWLTGAAGLGGLLQWSPPLRFRGADFQLGMLEFNRVAIALANGACGWALNVHIPAGEPLTVSACDDAFAAAREFFPRHFPDEPIAFFVCSSWLLDSQLAHYLPNTSNIVQFQRRFNLVPTPAKDDRRHEDHVLLEYVFGRLDAQTTIPPELLDQLPQETTYSGHTLRTFVPVGTGVPAQDGSPADPDPATLKADQVGSGATTGRRTTSKRDKWPYRTITNRECLSRKRIP